MELQTFEDFPVGRVVDCGTYRVSKDEILDFARQFDPQPHHLDEEAGKQSILGGLAASGWQVSAISMRMFCDGILSRAAAMGAPGVDEGRWMKPVKPDDDLRLEITILETRASKSKPQLGFVKMDWRVFNQREQVASFISSPMFARRNAHVV